MTDPITVLALRRKRDEISGVIAEYENKIKAAQHDLGHVVASLRLFELTGDPSEFPAYIDLNRFLRRGETTKICMAAIKAEGALDTRELTKRVMAAKGLNPDDKVMARAIALRVVQTLRMKARRGGVLDGSERRKGVSVWRLSDSRQQLRELSLTEEP
jgi:hypothetical protein